CLRFVVRRGHLRECTHIAAGWSTPLEKLVLTSALRPLCSAPRPMAAIELDHVSKIYAGDVRAVDDVSLTVADGDFMVLVGPSGCGKSTLLRMIAGLEEVTIGAVSIGGTDVTDFAPRHRDVAMVFQSYALYPHMTVRENMGYGLKVRRA